jgi:prepilin-type N-terminal cleavage/methylation domain-containing protein
MSPISAKILQRATRGFTLIELIVGMSLSVVLFAAILSGFTFLGRNLTRLVNTHDQEAKSRRAFHVFAKDISVATQVSSGSDVSLSLKIPGSGGTISTVTYTYDHPVGTSGTLTRTDSLGSTVLLTNLAAFDFNYFNGAGSPSTPGALGVKEVELSFTSTTGSAANGVETRYTSVSPRLLLRNKALLQ